MFTATHVINILVAPVVMISACGLFCLALFNRLAAVMGRIRVFHAESYENSRKLSALPLDKQTSNEAHVLRERHVALDAHSRRSLERATMIRNSLLALLSTVICMLLASLTLALAMIVPSVGYGALVIFFFGIATMLVGIVMAMAELFMSLESVSIEQSMAEELLRGDRPPPTSV